MDDRPSQTNDPAERGWHRRARVVIPGAVFDPTCSSVPGRSGTLRRRGRDAVLSTLVLWLLARARATGVGRGLAAAAPRRQLQRFNVLHGGFGFRGDGQHLDSTADTSGVKR